MIKVLIVDDEVRTHNVLLHYMSAFIPQITEAKVATSVAEARTILRIYQPDIVFLDVEMPFQNGFELLSGLTNPGFDIIFVTAHNQYAVQAVRASAFDYLLKPITPDDLIISVERYISKQRSASQKKQLYENLVNNVNRKDGAPLRLAVPSSEGVFFFLISEIIRLEADRNYTIIHALERRPFVASKTLKHFEELLAPHKFIRTHKSHLVNPDHVDRILGSHDFVIMSDNSRIEVSRRKKDELQHLLKNR